MKFRCSCGFAIDDADELGDHFRLAFARDDDIGADGRVHAQLAGGPAGRPECACGFTATSTPELDDHLLKAFITHDRMGNDGQKHVPADNRT